jgi:hypothetical protein
MTFVLSQIPIASNKKGPRRSLSRTALLAAAYAAPAVRVPTTRMETVFMGRVSTWTEEKGQGSIATWLADP